MGEGEDTPWFSSLKLHLFCASWHGCSRLSEPPGHTLAIICKKLNWLSISMGNNSNPDVIESKTVNEIVRDSEQKCAGGKNEGFSHYVIENIGSEIAVLGLAIMFMKNKILSANNSLSP